MWPPGNKWGPILAMQRAQGALQLETRTAACSFPPRLHSDFCISAASRARS